MGIFAGCALVHQALNQGRSQIRPVAGASEGKVRRHDLGLFRSTPGKDQFEALAFALDLRHSAVQLHCAAFIELSLEARMHFERQTMTVRIPQRADMTQEAGLFLDRKPSPDILQRGAQAVDDGLPWRTVCLGCSAGDGDRCGESRQAFGAGKPDLLWPTPFAACNRGSCPRGEITVTLPWNPWRRALNRTSTMVRPEPINAMDLALANRAGGSTSKGASAPVGVDAASP